MQKTVVHNFLLIPQSTFPLLQSTRLLLQISWESQAVLLLKWNNQTMTTTSSNIVETFVKIPFVEASEMTIDLLVQKTVVHSFLFRKVRFHCYSPQFKWNQAVLLLIQ